MADFLRPFPELVADVGDRFKIKNSGQITGWTDVVNRQMAVPTYTGDRAYDHLALMVRRHETLHARFSRRFKRTDPRRDQCLQWAEDWRITMIGLNVGVLATTCNRHSDCDICAAVQPSLLESLRGTLEALESSNPDDGAAIMLSLLQIEYQGEDQTPADEIAARIVGDIRTTVRRPGRRPFRSVKYIQRQSTLKIVADRIYDLLFTGDQPSDRGSGKPEKHTATGDQPQWGTMDVSRSHLSRTAASPSARTHKPSDSGSVPVNMARLTLDNRVFRRKVRTRGASVLIDGSGSMSWSDSDLGEVLESCPAAIVGVYEADSREGTLHILAEHGQHTNDLPVLRGSNVVDGPALQWLAQQPEPRYWISDGAVTEIRDHMTDRASRQCDAVCLANRITRIERGSDLISKLRGVK